ncbi:MAG TPA: type II secretion system protein [Verrucomicrobiae bacterium]
MTRRKTSAQQAFTLIEVMVAIAIFGMIIAVIYATWALVMKATQVGQTAASEAQRQRVAIHTIEDALICAQSFQASPQYYSFLLGDNMLSFTARLPEDYPRSSKFISNLRRLEFKMEAGDFGHNNLVLRQRPVLVDWSEDELKTPLILARNVKTFSVECWDTNQVEWVTEWNDTNSIPLTLRIGLVLESPADDHGRAGEKAIWRVISRPAQMMPSGVQRGAAPGQAPGGNPNNGPGGRPGTGNGGRTISIPRP